MLNQRHNRQAGFTLVEVMMASLILVVGFLGMIQALTIGSETLDTTRKQQIAAQIMETEIERLRASSWSTIAGLPASGTISIDGSGTISGDETIFALSNYTSVNTDDNTAIADLAKGFTCSFARSYLRPAAATSGTVTWLRLAYTVNWTSNTGRAYSRTTEAYFGQNGLHLSYQKT